MTAAPSKLFRFKTRTGTASGQAIVRSKLNSAKLQRLLEIGKTKSSHRTADRAGPKIAWRLPSKDLLSPKTQTLLESEKILPFVFDKDSLTAFSILLLKRQDRVVGLSCGLYENPGRNCRFFDRLDWVWSRLN